MQELEEILKQGIARLKEREKLYKIADQKYSVPLLPRTAQS